MSPDDPILDWEIAASRPPVQQLLVSVRSPPEVDAALAAGIDILDLKEPNDGALAPAPIELWSLAASRLQEQCGSVPALSAALGEIDVAVARRLARSLPASFSFAKAGPSGVRHEHELESLWSQIRSDLPRDTNFVAVAYADHPSADCLCPTRIFRLAKQQGIRHCLVDTFTKNGQSTFDVLGPEGLREIQSVAEEHGLWWALAGSIKAEQLAEFRLHGIQPNCLGVRGDVCESTRTSQLCRSRLSVWKSAVRINQPNSIPSD